MDICDQREVAADLRGRPSRNHIVILLLQFSSQSIFCDLSRQTFCDLTLETLRNPWFHGLCNESLLFRHKSRELPQDRPRRGPIPPEGGRSGRSHKQRAKPNAPSGAQNPPFSSHPMTPPRKPHADQRGKSAPAAKAFHDEGGGSRAVRSSGIHSRASSELQTGPICERFVHRARFWKGDSRGINRSA